MTKPAKTWLPPQEGRRVVVHTRSDESIEGLIKTVAKDGLVLTAAKVYREGPPAAAAGEVYIPHDNVAFIQRLTT